jgi:hypothetical protein
MVAVCGGVKSNRDENAVQRSERRAVDEDDNETYIIIATRHIMQLEDCVLLPPTIWRPHREKDRGFCNRRRRPPGQFGTRLGHDPPGNDQERVNVKATRLIWCCEVTLCNRTVQVIVVSSYIMRE